MQYHRVYGLTGGIACGKSTVARLFKKCGAIILDLDQVSRKVVKKGEQGLKKIIETFGKEYLLPDGNLDRKKMATLIFNDKKAKESLENILHPLIFNYEKEFVAKIRKNEKETPILVEAALMVETGSYKRYNKLIVVYVPKEIQIDRLIKRDNIDYNEAIIRLNSQMPIEEKKKFGDFIIDNSGTIEKTFKEVKKIYANL